MNLKNLMIVSLLLIFGGCASIPKNGAQLNSQVSLGIQRYQQEVESIIKTLGDVQRAILDEKWEEIYRKAEHKYRNEQGLDPASPLSQEQRIDVATIASGHREDILKEIEVLESELINKTRKNSFTLIEVNDHVTSYLLSLQKLDAAKQDITNKISSLVGIDIKALTKVAMAAIDKLP